MSCTSIKIISRPYRFLLRSYYVVQVLSASAEFLEDVVGSWPKVTGIAQADLNLRWGHCHFVGFVMRRLITFPFDVVVACGI